MLGPTVGNLKKKRPQRKLDMALYRSPKPSPSSDEVKILPQFWK